ncbi:Acyl-CoA synthetase (AMP-forming)/AMP-acid ligase II [Propionibacterium cyclohexanicum]|uniref:Acyl-CoA synthetase (AMP-forming)/AMP-acid ligase II n=2 Tax=Propionibacterium cyclohexanicum TaxID=64702 RepID=A0A1H9THE7_9ACTN|nr:Acyl-CoA synthetase (AMP-forming)/AMP-acid ligase II [Propionibacterium cyclohexanicum]
MTTRNTSYDPAALQQVFESHFTWASGFERNVHRYASRTAMTDLPSGRSWTYAELGADAGRLVAGLAAHGIGVGDVVAHQLLNCPEFAMIYLATQGLRAVSSPMNYRLAPGETAFILAQMRPAALVYDSALAPQIAQAIELADYRPGLLVAVGEGELLCGAIRFDELLACDAPSFTAAHDSSVWDETSRLFTSGTTGMPKQVPLTSLNEVLTAHDVIMHFPLDERDRTLNMSPWFHRGGNYCAGPNTMFYVGGEVVIMPKFDENAVLDTIEKRQLSYVIGAPTNLERLADAQEENPRDLSSLRGIVTMGAPLERAAALRYQQVLTPRIANGYGTTESFWNTFLRPYELPAGAGSAGHSCVDDDVLVVKVLPDRIARPTELAAKDGQEIGEVIMRTVKAGYAYLDNPSEEAEKFREGWVYPGDLATWDENETVTIVGRKDDMVISGGENVHPVQVEEVLGAHEGVAESIVTGLPDDEWGQLVVAYVRPKPGYFTDHAAAATQLDAFCRASHTLANYKRPRRYAFVDELPMTATGKKQHFVLKQRAPQDAKDGLFVRP